MRLFFLHVMSALLAFSLSSCAVKPLLPLQVKTGDRATLAFTGKGAGAGMMMDAYMGGMGVAIGIAIDEGIAKDIEKNVAKQSTGFNIISLVKTQLLTQSSKQFAVKFVDSNDSTVKKSVMSTNVVIETYGFKTFPGDGDKVTAWLKIRFSNSDGEKLLSYPDDFQSPQTLELTEVKTNPERAYGLLNNAVQLVVSRWMAEGQH